MKGRKPSHPNVVPLRQDGDTRTLEERADDLAKNLRPRGLEPAHRRLWDEIAPELAKSGRLKPLYVHTIHEYVIVLTRLRDIRADLAENGETYTVTGRNGTQEKSRPEVAQYNESWRNWRALAGDLGLSPSAERGLSTAIGDLFDDPAHEFIG